MKKSLLLLAMVLLNLLPLPANAEDTNTKPLSHIDTECLFTYYYNYEHIKTMEFQQTFRFDNCIVNNREYMALIKCDENGDYDKDATYNIYAYLREEDGKVYMLRNEAHNATWFGDVYGMTDRETVIYNYNLKPGDSYRIGELSDYYTELQLPENPTYHDILYWITYNYDAAIGAPYIYLCLWDYGLLTLKERRFDDNLDREVWTYVQKYFDPKQELWQYDNQEATWNSEGYRTFDVVDGFGCMQSLVAFPGLFPPCINVFNTDYTPLNPVLCKVQKLDTKEILFELTDLPHPPLVEELDTDGNAEPEYYNLQGQKVAAPEEGSIYIVKRGAKASKEVYCR